MQLKNTFLIYIILCLSILVPLTVEAAPTTSFAVQEIDGTPIIWNPTYIKVPNGSLTVSGRIATLDYAASFVPYTGATAAVNLGSYDFTTTGTIEGATLTEGGNAVVNEADSPDWSGTHNFGSATSVEIPNSSGVTVNAIGEIGFDTATTYFAQGQLVVYGNSAKIYQVGASNDPTDNYVPKYDAATDTVNWEAEAGGGAGVEDDAYGSGWDGDTTNAPSQNAVYDILSTSTTGATYREITFLPHTAGFDPTNPAIVDWVASSGTGLMRFPRAKFDDGENDTQHYTFIMPSDATASSAWILDIYSYSDEDVDENVVWGVQISATSDNDADNVEEQAADTVDTAIENYDKSEAKASCKVSMTIDYANCDGAVAGDEVDFIFYRVGADGSDDHTNEVYLRRLHLKIPRS